MAVITLSLRNAFQVKEYMQRVTAMKLSLRNKSKSTCKDVVLLGECRRGSRPWEKPPWMESHSLGQYSSSLSASRPLSEKGELLTPSYLLALKLGIYMIMISLGYSNINNNNNNKSELLAFKPARAHVAQKCSYAVKNGTQRGWRRWPSQYDPPLGGKG